MTDVKGIKGCRVCLVNDKNQEMIPIFGNNRIALDLFLISSIKVISINRIDFICKNCNLELVCAIKLRAMCIEADKFFRKDTYHVEQEEMFKNLENSTTLACDDDDIKKDISVDDNKLTIPKLEPHGQIIQIQKSSKEQEIGLSSGIAKCQLCHKTFTSLHSLKDHMRAIHEKLSEKDMHPCPFCSRLFKIKYYLNRHIKSTHTKEVQRKQKRPRLKFDHEEVFKEKLMGLNCPYCLKFLTSKHSLNDHIRVKHEFVRFDDRFSCDMCGKNFPLKYYLLRHIRASHLKSNRPIRSDKKKQNEALPCSICGKILKNKGNLSTHEKTHRLLSPSEYWYCDLCGNKFKGRGEMTVHIKKRHVLNVKYPCDICPNKSWRTLFQLQRHVKVFHNNIREFKCEWCGKGFGEKNKLFCHIRIHTGEQPFECQFCERKFTHQTDLRRHVWGHTGERPYKCERETCGKGFMKKSELKAHKSRCHPTSSSQLRRSTTLPIPLQYQ